MCEYCGEADPRIRRRRVAEDDHMEIRLNGGIIVARNKSLNERYICGEIAYCPMCGRKLEGDDAKTD